MAKSTVKDAEGTEFVLETGYGHVTKIEAPKPGGRNAKVEIQADGLRLPVKGSADSTNPDIWEPLNAAAVNGQRIAFRIEVHRDAKVDKTLPFDQVGQFDRFRRLVEIKPAAGVMAQPEQTNGSTPEPPVQSYDPGPSDPGAPFEPSSGPRIAEGKPWERTNSDGSLNLGSYAFLASVGTVEWAYSLLCARRAQKGLDGPPDASQVKGLASMLLDAADRTQAAVRTDGRVDRIDASHTRARGALRAIIDAHGIQWDEIAQPANRPAWVASLVDQASALLSLSVELDR